MQSRKASLLESLVNVAIGYVISVIATMIILPLFGFHVSVSDGMQITLLFTLVSVVRSYVLRRLFNHLTTRR